jgi:hypothetical protein
VRLRASASAANALATSLALSHCVRGCARPQRPSSMRYDDLFKNGLMSYGYAYLFAFTKAH